MAVALTLTQREYILKAERELPTSEQTVFMIRPLTAHETAQIDDIARMNDKGELVSLNAMILERVVRGLVGWRNLKHAEGAELPFSKDQTENLNRIIPYIPELSTAIDALTELKADEVKN